MEHFPTLAVGGAVAQFEGLGFEGFRNCRFQFRLVNVQLELGLGLTFWNQFHERKQKLTSKSSTKLVCSKHVQQSANESWKKEPLHMASRKH